MLPRLEGLSYYHQRQVRNDIGGAWQSYRDSFIHTEMHWLSLRLDYRRVHATKTIIPRFY